MNLDAFETEMIETNLTRRNEIEPVKEATPFIPLTGTPANERAQMLIESQRRDRRG